ncbi:primosomal protein N' [Flindersiella endophytica]
MQEQGEQLELIRKEVRRTSKPKPPRKPAPELPVARVAVEVSLAHLDRPFDYTVPETMHETCVPGCRVRVRFAGQDLDGFVLERVAESDHQGRLMPLRKVVSAEPVLSPEVARLARLVADRYAGTLADVLRLAVPPRHAKAEASDWKPGPNTDDATADAGTPAADGSRADGNQATEPTDPAAGSAQGVPASEGSKPDGFDPAGSTAEPAPDSALDSASDSSAGGGSHAIGSTPGSGPRSPDSAGTPGHESSHLAGPWAGYDAGPAYLAALRRGDGPRAVWTALPAEDWPRCLAVAAAATLASGRGVLIVVPDHRDIARLDDACAEVLGPDQHVALVADLPPAERYRRFLAVRRGHVKCVIGTRAAAFAPVDDLGLVVCWDDGDDLHSEPRAPYPHVREVLSLRAHQTGAAALIGGFACTAEAAQLLESGWARPLAAGREAVRTRAPNMQTTGDTMAELSRDTAARAVRLPHKAFEAARAALSDAPVLVQVPRSGYVPALACQDCRERARCEACAGPLQLASADRPAACGWCGRPATAWRCPYCGGNSFRAPIIGSRRTADEMGKAFPKVPVRVSGGDRVLSTVGPRPALVIATPGAEPVAEGGYGAALLLDGWLLQTRADLRATEETLRRWLNAAALVRSSGSVVVVGDPGVPVVQALVRWSPGWFAERELAERRSAGFPPAVRLAAIEGPRISVLEIADLLKPPPGAEVLGPVPLDEGGEEDDLEEQSRLIVRAPRREGAALAAALKSAAGVRSAHKAAGAVRIQVDPHELG